MMRRHTSMPIALLAAGVLLAMVAGVTSGLDSQWVSTDRLPAGDPAPRQPDGLTREQLAGLHASLAGVPYQPPACVVGQERFTDVPASSPFCRWIEELARRGITVGCTTTQYCPNAAVTRAQMAAFVVKAMEACPTLDPTDEMIRVGGICIDKYEASLWDAPVGGSQITEAIPCSDNGQDCDNIYARSVAGVLPRWNITWFQAQAALANSGKRLPTNDEWQMAVRGTPDDTGPGTTPCNTRSVSVQNTGANVDCVSAWGAFDMVGNALEWVADWAPFSTSSPGWGGFSDDGMALSGASTAQTFPGALSRGGLYFVGDRAGPLEVRGSSEPFNSVIGFRGAR